MYPFSARHISVSINRSLEEVYSFASNPLNLSAWAAGLSGSIRQEGSEWIAESPMGTVKVKFAEKNNLGILDHYVTLPSGAIVYVPMRVVQNNSGSEVIFTLFRLPDMSEDDFSRDGELVERDLKTLKTILEGK
jgi:hypothetical protein